MAQTFINTLNLMGYNDLAAGILVDVGLFRTGMSLRCLFPILIYIDGSFFRAILGVIFTMPRPIAMVGKWLANRNVLRWVLILQITFCGECY